MEVQSHGVLFEDSIIRSITGLSKSEYQNRLPNAYTASMDVVRGINSDANFSVKTSKGGHTVGCGDILRFMQHCLNDEFTIVVGAWQQVTLQVKRYDRIYEFDIKPEDYHKLWRDITPEVIQPFVDYVKSIPPGKVAQLENRSVWKQRRQIIYDQFGRGLCAIDAKIDSQNQRRVQCSFKPIEFINTGIIFRQYENEYKGIQLPYEQLSAPRQFS
jgi:hypothetical protein